MSIVHDFHESLVLSEIAVVCRNTPIAVTAVGFGVAYVFALNTHVFALKGGTKVVSRRDAENAEVFTSLHLLTETTFTTNHRWFEMGPTHTANSKFIFFFLKVVITISDFFLPFFSFFDSLCFPFSVFSFVLLAPWPTCPTMWTSPGIRCHLTIANFTICNVSH